MAADEHHASTGQPASSMRVLVAFEDLRSTYRDVFVRALRDLRPALTVRSASIGELEGVLGSFDPHVVVCSRPNGAHPGARGAWIHIPTEDGPRGDEERLAKICLDGENWRTDGPPLSELLGVLDETHERLREGELSEAC